MKSSIAMASLALAWCVPAIMGRAEESPLNRPAGTIIFASIAPRGWDLYVADTQTRQSRQLTEHPTLDYNAAFSPGGNELAFVSERDGYLKLYSIQSDGTGLKRLTTGIPMDDHPTWSPDGRRIAFASTRRPAETVGQAWTAIHVMNADGSGAQCVSPTSAADYSPAWSPKGDVIAFASGSGRAEAADLWIMKPDGSDRRLVTTNGGWPSFAADGQSLFFHRVGRSKWGIWRVNLDGSGLEQVSPPDVDAFTPQTSADGRWLVAALRRGSHRQIEVMDLTTQEWSALTTEATDHWNPSISADGKQVTYHKSTAGVTVPHVELWGAPEETDLKLVRVAGSFPALSPDHRRLALIGDNFTRLDVMNIDGSERKTLYTGKHRGVFSVAWPRPGGEIAFGVGGSFQGPKGEVDLMRVQPDGANLAPLTEGNGNDAFPSFAPDGRQLVFRSGRDGNKNLYVMNHDGGGLRQLTQGKWTDTMAHWSPTGEWITFASDRDGNFDIWLIRPDGRGLRKLVGGGGRNTHPYFAPDGQWVVFTSQRAGYSAEEVSLPPQPQPYGDLFAVRRDGSGLMRLFHNAFEEGTPAWGPVLAITPSPDGRQLGGVDY